MTIPKVNDYCYKKWANTYEPTFERKNKETTIYKIVEITRTYHEYCYITVNEVYPKESSIDILLYFEITPSGENVGEVDTWSSSMENLIAERIECFL